MKKEEYIESVQLDIDLNKSSVEGNREIINILYPHFYDIVDLEQKAINVRKFVESQSGQTEEQKVYNAAKKLVRKATKLYLNGETVVKSHNRVNIGTTEEPRIISVPYTHIGKLPDAQRDKNKQV